jgi:hypothetical protein
MADVTPDVFPDMLLGIEVRRTWWATSRTAAYMTSSLLVQD